MITRLIHTRVLVADQSFLGAQRTRFQVISAGFPVVRTICHGDRVLSVVSALKPDILVMDVELPGQNGFEITQQLMAQHPLAIILLTTNSDKALMKEALHSGACAYLLKPLTSVGLSQALKLAAIHSRHRYMKARLLNGTP